MSVDATKAFVIPAPVRAFTRYVRWFCWGSCLLLAIVMILQILLRSFTSIPITWTDELLKIIFTWMGLLTMVTTMWDRGHIAVDSIVRWMPPKIRFGMIVIEHALMLGLMVLLIPFMWDLVVVAQGQKTLAMGLPMVVFYIAFPVCFALLAIDRAFALYGVIRAGVQS
ncbi:MAG: hypothetical protein DELT_00597 [Desulfovibrio sp.]